MGFLALGKKLHSKELEIFPKYQYYFDLARWDDLVASFQIEMQQIYALTIDS